MIDLRQEDTWQVLESLTGSVDMPADWSTCHNFYLYKQESNEHVPRTIVDDVFHDYKELWQRLAGM